VKGRVLNVNSISSRDEQAWRSLAERAVEPNPLFEPDCVIPAARHQTFGSEIDLVVAEENDEMHAAMPVRRLRRWHKVPYPIMTTQVRRMIYLGTPLVAAERGIDACGALFDTLITEREGGGSRVLAIEEITSGGPVDAFVRAAAEQRGLPRYEFESFDRGFMRRRAAFDSRDIHRSETIRTVAKKRRRLAREIGEEPQMVDRGGASSAVMDYIALESSGYKAELGVAMTTAAGEPNYFREMCRSFSNAGRLHVVALEAAGRTLAMNIWIRAGAGMFMIKSSFDEKYSEFSPGLQLMLSSLEYFQEHTDAAFIDSCTYKGNDFLLRMFPDRRTVASHFVVLADNWRHNLVDRAVVRSFLTLRPLHTRLYARLHPEERFSARPGTAPQPSETSVRTLA
jgi:hypothetical protein